MKNLVVRFLKWSLNKLEPQKPQIVDPSPWAFPAEIKTKPRVAKATTRIVAKKATTVAKKATKKAK